MDQGDFRQLLAKQDHQTNTSNVSDNSGGDATLAKARAKTLFGRQQRRDASSSGAGGAGGDKSDAQHSLIAPRHVKIGNGSNHRLRENRRTTEKSRNDEEQNNDESGSSTTYVDRAEARRKGLHGGAMQEYAEAERVRRAFQQRLDQAKTDKERTDLERQMAFLGGDEQHTILVKGLDFALLERQKAKQQGADDELERAFAAQLPSRMTSSTGKRERETREDTDTTSAKEAAQSSSLTSSKFRPIGKPQKSSENDSPEYIWRNGKRMRKKRKVNTHDDSQSETRPLSMSEPKQHGDREKVYHSTSRRSTSEQGGKKREDEERASYNSNHLKHLKNDKAAVGKDEGEEATREEKSTEAVIDPKREEAEGVHLAEDDSDDESQDIFAGAGRWEGVGQSDHEGSESDA